MIEQKTLFLMTERSYIEGDLFADLVNHMRNEIIFYVDVDDFNLDSEDALKEVSSWITEYPFGCGVLIIETPAEFRAEIIKMAKLESWKIIEFEIVLRETKSGEDKDE